MTTKSYSVTLLLFMVFAFGSQIRFARAQTLKALTVSTSKGLEVASFDNKQNPSGQVPLVSFKVGDKEYNSLDAQRINGKSQLGGIGMEWKTSDYNFGAKLEIKFTNQSNDTVLLHNIIPLGQAADHGRQASESDVRHSYSLSGIYR